MLLIDIGNSWLKSAYFQDEVLHHICPVETSDFRGDRKVDWSLPEKKMLSPKKILVSSVASQEVNEKCHKILLSELGIEPYFVQVQKTYKGLTTLYATSKLGVDRWLACLAAWSKYKKNLIVIDAGTAITVDFINYKGTHLGGLITPGPSILANALAGGTAHLPVVSRGEAKMIVPTDTEEAIGIGLDTLLLGFMNQVKAECSQIYDSDPLWVLTGGAANTISAGIKWPHFTEQNLVLDGLKIFAIG